jgi:CRP-like cAMP-binding protein
LIWNPAITMKNFQQPPISDTIARKYQNEHIDMQDLNQAIVASVQPSHAQIRAISLFENLNESEYEQISNGLVCRHIPRGSYLFHQGLKADSAFFVQSGFLDVASMLPGGDENILASLGPGSVIGETSLISTGIRSASVRAKSDVIGFTMERQFFLGLIAQAHTAASRILAQLIKILCERLHSQYAHTIEIEQSSEQLMPCHNASGYGPRLDDIAVSSVFPYRQYLPRLDFFSNFRIDEIDFLETHVHCLELPRGTLLFEKDEVAIACYFVVRGALELFISGTDRHVPLIVLGPGKFLGTTDIITGDMRVACARAREDVVLLEIGAGTLRQLLSAQSLLAVKFQHCLCESLVVDLGMSNKRAARIARGMGAQGN